MTFNNGDSIVVRSLLVAAHSVRVYVVEGSLIRAVVLSVFSNLSIISLRKINTEY